MENNSNGVRFFSVSNILQNWRNIMSARTDSPGFTAGTVAETTTGFYQRSPFELGIEAISYLTDAFQRSWLYWDVMRERGNTFMEHFKEGMPPVLVFEYDMIVDGRSLEEPVNYALVRIRPPDANPSDPHKRPFVVIDPRAGHGPGIGGSKIDSEIGLALRAGHPCYFVTFFPKPVAGQTIESVARAEGIFLKKVNDLHPDAEGRPFVIGNCQGGWALLILAAVAPELFGPILLAGSPVSYWAGVEGKNPMRYTGGLLGGSWLSSLASDLGNGILRRYLHCSEFRKPQPGQYAVGQTIQSLFKNRLRSSAIPRFREVVGRAFSAEQRRNRMDSPKPLRRQQTFGQ